MLAYVCMYICVCVCWWVCIYLPKVFWTISSNHPLVNLALRKINSWKTWGHQWHDAAVSGNSNAIPKIRQQHASKIATKVNNEKARVTATTAEHSWQNLSGRKGRASMRVSSKKCPAVQIKLLAQHEISPAGPNALAKKSKPNVHTYRQTSTQRRSV